MVANPRVAAPIVYPPGNLRKETMHTLSYVRPSLRPGDRVIDIGCGGGHVLAELAAEHQVKGVDIVDLRVAPLEDFALYDGEHVPAADNEFDVALLTFVLHHVPNDKKAQLVREAARVASRAIVLLEDTPRTALDRLACDLHGRSHRKRIGTTADYGFYSQPRWEEFFRELGLRVTRSEALPRWTRDLIRPWARSVFVVEK